MSRHVEVKPGKTLTVTGPANVHIKGGPALSGTQPVPGMVPGEYDLQGQEENGSKKGKANGQHTAQSATHRTGA